MPKITPEQLQDKQAELQKTLRETLSALKIVSGKLGQLHKTKNGRQICDCEHSTLICLKHGTILGSEVCKECGAYLGITEEY